MPSLRVTKNSELLCAVGSNDVWTFSASVWADVWGPERSTLTVTGSSKAAEGETGVFLVWHLGHELKANDRVAFSFATGSTSSPIDETPIEEPSADEQVPDFFGPVPEEELLSLESRPVKNADCKWQFYMPDKPTVCIAPDETRQHCSLQITWTDHRPERLRVNLSKSSLREISARAGGEELFLEYLPLGAQFELAVETQL